MCLEGNILKPGFLAAQPLGNQGRHDGDQAMINELPQDYQARPARMDDVEAVVRMFNADAVQQIGIEKFTIQDTGGEWRTPGFNLETDTRVVLTPDAQIVGYYEVWDINQPHVTVNCWGRVHPAHTDRGVGSYLLEWAEGRAHQAIPKAPADARIVMTCFVLSQNQAAHELFQSTGMRLVRHSLRMVIDLNGQPPTPQCPEGIHLRSLVVNQDERRVVQSVREAFSDHWGYVEIPFEEEYEHWLHHISTNERFDPSLWFLAWDGDEIAGISLCWPNTQDDVEMGWVGTLGVRRPWRRCGLGLALLQHSFAEFYRRGMRRVGLGVDAQNLTGALRLYERAGMHSDPARQYCTYEKELRPGFDLRKQ